MQKRQRHTSEEQRARYDEILAGEAGARQRRQNASEVTAAADEMKAAVAHLEAGRTRLSRIAATVIGPQHPVMLELEAAIVHGKRLLAKTDLLLRRMPVAP